jgi:glycosyltransferase involved in cell wall biosynthesis
MKHAIWVVNKYSSGHEDGFETRTMAIAREWVRAGHDVVICCSNANHLMGKRDMADPVEHRILDGVHVVRVRTLQYSRTGSMRRVLSWFDFECRLLTSRLPPLLPSPTVVITSSLSILSVISGLVLARRYNVPWVFEVRDIWPLTLVEEGRVSRWNPLSILLAGVERLGYLKAKLVVGTMPNLRAHVRAVVKRDVPVVCVPFGFNPSSAPDSCQRTVDASEKAHLVVGYAGSIGVSNALHTLVEAARSFRDDSRFRFVIAGDGDSRAELMEATRDCPNVTWRGRVPRSQVHEILSGCDLLYFAAQKSKVWEYGMSLNKLTDYLLSARPILGSYSGFPSILDEAGCGRFIPAADTAALISSLETFRQMDPASRAEMGRKGRDWLFEHRTWTRIAMDYVAHLTVLVHSSKGTRKGVVSPVKRTV